MKLSYYPETDSLYISFKDKPGADVVPVSDGVVVDVDESGRPVGVDIHQGASAMVDLSYLSTAGFGFGRVERGDV